MLKRFFPEELKPYSGRITLTIVGFVVAVLFLTLGFWPTLLLAILTAAGFITGSIKDGVLKTDQLPFSHRRR